MRYTIAYNYFNVHLQYLKFYNLLLLVYFLNIFSNTVQFCINNLFEVINLNKYCLVIHALSDVQRIFSLKFDVFGRFNPNSMPGQAIIYFQYKACIMFFETNCILYVVIKQLVVTIVVLLLVVVVTQA